MVATLSSAVCPICGAELSSFSRGRTFHARAHNLSSECLYRLTFPEHRAICECSPECEKTTSWKGWEHGYARFAKGHCSSESKADGTAKRLAKLRSGEIAHWSKGKTKETDARLAASGKKASTTLREKSLSGEFVPWVLGKTKFTHTSIARAIEKRAHTFESQGFPNRTDTATLIAQISSSLGEAWEILSGLDTLDERSTNVAHALTLRCRKCELISARSVYNIVRHRSLKCSRCNAGQASAAQNEIFEWVVSLGVKAYNSDTGTIPGWELDVSVPDAKFAIDFNGLYWHSELVQKNKSQHNVKSRIALKHGIRLFHVFEDEWRDKRDIVKSMVMHRLSMSPTRIFARKCSITILDSKDARDFFAASHIDSHTRCTIAFGLVKDGELVAALSLRKPFHKKWHNRFEVARFATKLNVSVIGALGKLTARAKEWAREQGAVGLLTYADTRFGGAECYGNSGWVDDGFTGIGFWWTDCVNRTNRFSTRASSEESEGEVALRKRVVKIWGCQNRRFLVDF